MQAVIVKLLISSLKGVLFSFLSEKILKSLIFSLLEKFTEWTDTDMDDALLAMAKANKEPLHIPVGLEESRAITKEVEESKR